MVFTFLLHPKASKELERIGNPIRSRIMERLRELKDNPDAVGKLLKPISLWSPKIGDYCAIYEVDRARKQVIILFIGHGKKVYDDFSKLL